MLIVSGSNLRSLKAQHEDEMEKLRMHLIKEHEERQEHALQKQADTLQQVDSVSLFHSRFEWLVNFVTFHFVLFR